MYRSALVVAIVAALLMGSAVPQLRPAAHAQTSGWRYVEPLPITVRWLAAATGLDGRIYAFGGDNGTANVGNSYVYDSMKNAWLPIASMPAPDDGRGARVAAEGKIFLMGGWDGQQPVNWVQAYDPSTNTWSCSFGGPGCKSSDLKPMP